MHALLLSLFHMTVFRAVPLAELPPSLRRVDIEILVPALILIGIVVAAFVIWTLRTLHVEKVRALQLRGDLQTIREQSQRRLQFLNVLSHDLRTPLNGITLQAHVIDQALAGNDLAAVAQALANIRACSNLAAEILEALLQYARIELDQNVLSTVSLARVFLQTAEPFRAAAEEKKLHFTLDVPVDLTAKTDRAKLQRALANLLDNAVKFTAHGSILVHARLEASPSVAALEIGSTRHRDRHPCIVICVTDTGAGIAPNEHGRIFHEFFQSQNPSRDAHFGLGLGLVMAQRLARQLGGRLEFTSEYQKGSTFMLTIPQVADEVEKEPRLQTAPSPRAWAGRMGQASPSASTFSRVSFR